jgi:hypothetical protein
MYILVLGCDRQKINADFSLKEAVSDYIAGESLRIRINCLPRKSKVIELKTSFLLLVAIWEALS